MRWIRSRVSGVTAAWPFITRDTVATDTPASRATSLIVVAIGFWWRRGAAVVNEGAMLGLTAS